MLGRININRNAQGRPPLNRVWCQLCRRANDHFIWNCPNLKCIICGERHLINNCRYTTACHWCGSRQHLSELCNDPQGRTKKAACFVRCLKCGKRGHFAKDCRSGPRLNRYGTRRRRRRYGRRRRRYRRRRN
jgi:hypothetical protein